MPQYPRVHDQSNTVDPSATYGPRLKYTSSTPMTPATSLTTSGSTYAIGYDATDGLLILAGQSNIFRSADNGTTISGGLGIPLSGQLNPGNQVSGVVRFGALWICAITNQSTGGTEIYTSPAPGTGGTCTWTLRQALTIGSARFFGTIATDGVSVLVGEYGDPLTAAVKNPHVWQSTDGTTWTATWSASGSNNRHVHCVAPDPYVAGTWYVTYGDGPSPCLLKSTDGGLTWAGIAAIDSVHQSVSISFDQTYIYLAPDATSAGMPTDVWVLDRATQTVLRAGTTGDHRRIAVPNSGAHSFGGWTSGVNTIGDFIDTPFVAEMVGARITGSGIPAGTTIASITNTTTAVMSANATSTKSNTAYQVHWVEQWYSDPFYGVVDPATGIYYFTNPGDSTGATNIRRGLFCIPYVGGPVQLLEVLPGTGTKSLFIAGGYLYAGCMRRPLITV